MLPAESDEAKWQKSLRRENRKWITLSVCNKITHGTLNAAFMAFNKLAKALKSWGVAMNLYDPCVRNSIVGGHQLTLLFHMDDTLLTRESPPSTMQCAKKLDGMHDANDPLTVTRGRARECLGITLDFRDKRQCAFTQCDFINKFWLSLPEDLRGLCSITPDLTDLFKADADAETLDEKTKDQCHIATAKSLHFSQRTRIDMQISTGHHCTRVKEKSAQDWGKFRKLTECLWSTRFTPLTIGINDEREVRVHINGAHKERSDGKEHSGMFLTMGKEGMMSASRNLGLFDASSTGTKAVADGKFFPKFSWFRHFRLAQGDQEKEDLLFQYDQNCVILHKHHLFSEGKVRNHANIRRFFTADKVEKKEIRAAHFLTNKKIACCSAKPNQGRMFVCQRNVMQITHKQDNDSYKNGTKRLWRHGDYGMMWSSIWNLYDARSNVHVF